MYAAIHNDNVALLDECVKAGTSVTKLDNMTGVTHKTIVPPLYFAKTQQIVDCLLAAGASPDVDVIVDGKTTRLREANPLLLTK
jgi:hypothetical protein